MTALTFDLDPTDEAVLSLLTGVENLPVHIGSVGDSDDNAKTVSAPLPYLLYGSTLGRGVNPRLTGARSQVGEFTATYVHNSLRGAKAVAVAVRDLLSGATVTIDGKPRRVRLDQPDIPVYVERDQIWTRPGGLPLFFAVDRWYVL